MAEQIIPNAARCAAGASRPTAAARRGSCLEVLDGHPTGVPVRDSKVPGGPTLLFPAAGWSAFVTAVRDGSL